jgi:hypothetical protein
MPILNYTTEVPADKSVGQIVALLSRKQAQSITQEFLEDGRVKAISFSMKVGVGFVSFQLPANIEGVHGILQKEAPYNNYRQCSRDAYFAKLRSQAERIAWRIVKDWVEAQMAMIESGQAEAAQVFLPYARQHDGRTVYELFIESHQRQLGSGESH